MTGPTRRRLRHADPCAPAAIDATIAELLRYPTADRMALFAARMIEMRAALVAAHPGASLRDLSTRGQEAGLRILDAITAAAHREQQATANKLETSTKEDRHD